MSGATVTETFFTVEVADMARARAFYVEALGATVSFSSEIMTSVHLAGVRVGLVHSENHAGARTGLHFTVTDLAAARAAVERAGGRAGAAPVEVAPGVVVAVVVDSEGNELTLK